VIKYITGIEDNETFLSIAFAIILSTIILAFLSQNTSIFDNFHLVLIGKEEFKPWKDYKAGGLKFTLENNAIFAILLFTGLTILICALIFRYVLGHKLLSKFPKIFTSWKSK
jgi:hypothetical protein